MVGSDLGSYEAAMAVFQRELDSGYSERVQAYCDRLIERGERQRIQWP